MFDVPATGCWSLFSLCGSDTTRPERPVAIGPRLVVGTLNLIADNENPWQFMPPESDQSPQFMAHLETASKAFDAVTVDDTLKILDAAVEAGVDVDFMAYPMERHGLRGKAREHFYRKMTRYFLDRLPPPPQVGLDGAIQEVDADAGR